MKNQTIKRFLRTFILPVLLGVGPCAFIPAQTSGKSTSTSAPFTDRIGSEEDIAIKKYEIPRSALEELDNVIKDSARYLARKNHTIDSLKTLIRKTPARDLASRVKRELELAECYRLFNADSAVAHAIKGEALAKSLGDRKEIFNSKIELVVCLSTGGIGSESESILAQIKKEELDKDEKLLYWYAARILYGYKRFFSHGFPKLSETADTLYWASNDSLAAGLPVKSPFRMFLKGEILIQQGQYMEAATILEKLMEENSRDTNLYSMAAYQRALIYLKQGNETMYANYLAKSAAGDVKMCVREGLALPALAEWLYAQGDLNTASNYINMALNDASLGAVRTRTFAIAKLLPSIDNSYRTQISQTNKALVFYLVCSCILLIILAVLLFFLFRQIKKSRANEKKVIQSSQLKNFYIGNFIALSSNYAQRLDEVSKLVIRKINAGQPDDLVKLVKGGKFGITEDLDFDKIFDSAFLRIYPNFVESLNKLLKPDEQVEYTEGESGEKRLTSELRIYALVRLGISESHKIAKIMRYSVSTVYAYRNRMRNRAINRETFEDEVAKA